MLKLLPITIVSILLAWISHSLSKSSAGSLTYDKKKESFFWFVMTVSMILFVGLRTSWNDTFHYTHAYELIDRSASIFRGINLFSLASNPGFNIVNRIMVKLGFSVQDFLMTYAAVTIGINMWFLRKYTNNLGVSVFLYFTMDCYVFSMAAIKQCVAVAICLVGVDRAIRKKNASCIVWVVVAMLFHPYAFMYALTPLLFFVPWSKKTWYLLLGFGIAGILLQPMMRLVVGLTTILGQDYSADLLSGEGINIFRLLVVSVPILLSYLKRKEIAARHDPVLNLVVNLSMLNAEIMFVGLFGTANYFGRLANYFLVFQTLALPKLIALYKRDDRKLLNYGMVIGYCAYFVYAYAINVKFDDGFRSVTLLDYLKALF